MATDGKGLRPILPPVIPANRRYVGGAFTATFHRPCNCLGQLVCVKLLPKTQGHT